MPLFSPKVIHWSKILSKFVSVQLVVQALIFTSGIILIRTLDKNQYAYFTIANTMQGSMHVLSDSGISVGLSVIGGKVWQDKYRFGQLINTALQLRVYLAAVVIPIVTLILLWLLITNGASFTYAILIAATLLVGITAQLTIGVLDIVPRLHSQFNRIQTLELVAAISRLIFVGVAYLTFLNAAVAVTTASLSLLIKRFAISHWAAENIDVKAPVDKEYRKEILRIIKVKIPQDIFYCIQGQITVTLITFFGKTQSIAEVGALGRLAVAFSVISAVISGIFLPRFARCQSVDLLQRQYWQIMGSVCLFGLLLLGITAFFPTQVLWILGKKYAHLQSELFLIALGTGLDAIIVTMWSINATKAWLEHSWVNIPGTLLTQTLLVLVLNVSTVKGVILFSILSSIPVLMINIALTYRGFSSYNSDLL